MYGAPESGWPSSDSSWQSYYMLRTATKLSISFQVLKEIFFLGLGVTVRLTSKKYKNKTQKTLKMYKQGCRDGMPKSMLTRYG